MEVPTGPYYVYRAKLRRVIDGDTFIADVDLGFAVWVAIRVRLRGVDAPARNTTEGRQAAAYLNHLLGGKDLLLQSYKDIRSFERWVCDVWVDQEFGEMMLVADCLVEQGHAERVQG